MPHFQGNRIIKVKSDYIYIIIFQNCGTDLLKIGHFLQNIYILLVTSN